MLALRTTVVDKLERTDIAPNRSPVNRVVSPDDPVDELNETLRGSPRDVEDTSDIPG